MLAGIREILIISNPSELYKFKTLLGDGSDFGVTFSYEVQPNPDGLAQSLIIGERFINGDSTILILGDNIFHGAGLGRELQKSLPTRGAQIFTYEVAHPEEYGIVTFDSGGRPLSVEEKPKQSTSNSAITGLYFFDERGPELAKLVTPSHRGELEITSVIERYLEMGELTVSKLSRGAAWLDTGNPNAMHDASTYVRVIEERTGLKIGCPEEAAFINGWLTTDKLSLISQKYRGNPYGKYLKEVALRQTT